MRSMPNKIDVIDERRKEAASQARHGICRQDTCRAGRRKWGRNATVRRNCNRLLDWGVLGGKLQGQSGLDRAWRS